jgi:hypothetical protein
VAEGDAVRVLQTFIDERWAVAQPKHFPGVETGPRVPSEVTAAEAGYFVASVCVRGAEPPFLVVDDDRKERSDRYPRLNDGSMRGYHFFEAPGRLRLETIVQWAAMSRLRDEFGWPREHIVCESPDIVRDGRVVLRYEALDILLLEEPCSEPPAKMSIATARSRVGIEVKATPKLLGKLIDTMRRCQAASAPLAHANHNNCRAIAELRPPLFLGVAANTWRLFAVVERNGQAVLGDELPDLDRLSFLSNSPSDVRTA